VKYIGPLSLVNLGLHKLKKVSAPCLELTAATVAVRTAENVFKRRTWA